MRSFIFIVCIFFHYESRAMDDPNDDPYRIKSDDFFTAISESKLPSLLKEDWKNGGDLIDHVDPSLLNSNNTIVNHTPLGYVVNRGEDPAFIEHLIQHGASFDVPCVTARTDNWEHKPIFDVFEHGNPEILKIFLAYGALAKSDNQEKEKLFCYAIKKLNDNLNSIFNYYKSNKDEYKKKICNNYLACMEMLIQNNCKITNREHPLESPFMKAINLGSIPVIQLFLEKVDNKKGCIEELEKAYNDAQKNKNVLQKIISWSKPNFSLAYHLIEQMEKKEQIDV